MSIDHPLFGRKFVCNGRLVTVGESYDGHGEDDPPGYYYQFDGEKQSHWISARAVPIRFGNLHANPNDAQQELRVAGYHWDTACHGQWVNDKGEAAKVTPIGDKYYVSYLGK